MTYLRSGAPLSAVWAGVDGCPGCNGMSVQDFVLIPGFAPAVGRTDTAGTEGLGTVASLKDEQDRELKAELARLRQEHRDLDVAIEALHTAPGSDLLQVQRLKKRKLVLRDRIIQIEDQLTPDIIA